MITRSNLAEQLREYQIRSKYDWASVSFFSSSASNLTSSRVDVVIFVLWELVILAFLVFSAVSLYFQHLQLALILICVTMLLVLCMRIAKQDCRYDLDKQPWIGKVSSVQSQLYQTLPKNLPLMQPAQNSCKAENRLEGQGSVNYSRDDDGIRFFGVSEQQCL
ncbi:hypothetical protein SAY87_012087 [Trapa incisa]|uniref:Uncharacterized protein n=1 Tax=Trapa incisa TaxID=236973 RepID=A0AAN7GGJ8_9MYRT|nr:hypothetical protein SAY87_012087 [Trapa incisa]